MKLLNQAPNKQCGVVIVVLLWVITIATVLITLMASNVHLASTTAFQHQHSAAILNDTKTALNMALFELMLESMPEPVKEKKLAQIGQKNPLYRFNGSPLTLYHQAPKNLIVRIYNHSGKINLKLLSPKKMQQLLEKRLGGNPEIKSLLDAWQDWVDNDDLKRLNGAEKSYYLSLVPPYTPRNDFFETVDELRLVKGFNKVFPEDFPLSAAFSLYGTGKVNPNFASREAFQLVPGMDDALIDAIMNFRESQEIKSIADLLLLSKVKDNLQLDDWIDFSTSTYYTIAIHPDTEQNAQYAFTVIVKSNRYSSLPAILQVSPYGQLPVSGL